VLVTLQLYFKGDPWAHERTTNTIELERDFA
jgi:hypothetical protein